MATVNPSSVRNVTGSVVDLTPATPAGDVLNLSSTSRAFLLTHNSSTETVTVTLAVPGTTWNGHDMPDTQVTVGPNQLVITPVPAERYSDGGTCALTYSSAAGLRIAAATT